MKAATPLAGATSRLRRAWATFDHVLFRRLDRDAAARGWEVHGTGRGRRVYRDPRWHDVVGCAACEGSSLAAARTCPDCGGRGTVRLMGCDPVRLADGSTVRLAGSDAVRLAGSDSAVRR